MYICSKKKSTPCRWSGQCRRSPSGLRIATRQVRVLPPSRWLHAGVACVWWGLRSECYRRLCVLYCTVGVLARTLKPHGLRSDCYSRLCVLYCTVGLPARTLKPYSYEYQAHTGAFFFLKLKCLPRNETHPRAIYSPPRRVLVQSVQLIVWVNSRPQQEQVLAVVYLLTMRKLHVQQQQQQQLQKQQPLKILAGKRLHRLFAKQWPGNTSPNVSTFFVARAIL